MQVISDEKIPGSEQEKEPRMKNKGIVNQITEELEDWNETRITKKKTRDEEIRQLI